MAKVKSFEESMAELENIVAALEKGVKLAKECHTVLDNAEQKIKILTETNEPEGESE